MKMTSMLIATVLVTQSAIAAAHDDAKASSLRGQTKVNPMVDTQSVAGHYFGLHFADSPFSRNPWATVRGARIVEDLDPSAPFDVLDKTLVKSWSGSAQVEPGKDSANVGYTHPDFVPPYLHPRPFPKEKENSEKDGIMIPIGDRLVVAHEDRLRLPQGIIPTEINDLIAPYTGNPHSSLGGYPLTAPADRISDGPWAVAHLDKVPGHYDQFFDQAQQREAARLAQKKLSSAFNRVDTDDDSAISSTEYDAEVKGHQKKTDDQSQILWKQYKVSESPDMSQAEFTKLAKTGYDLGQRFVNRSDISAILKPPQGADDGFWGGGAACPDGSYIKGAQIKVAPNKDDGDNTALNAVKFKCDDGSEIQTAEGPNGAWTKWAECPEGQKIASLSVRIMGYVLGQDNSGINDLIFQCRSDGQESKSTLKFGKATPPNAEQKGFVFHNGKYIKKSETDIDDKATIVGAGKVATQGGWSDELTCGTNSALCGAQGRLSDVKDAEDNLGVSDFRFFCCSKSLDCAEPCKEPTNTACKSCKTKVFEKR